VTLRFGGGKQFECKILGMIRGGRKVLVERQSDGNR
jgi:hypothetical protein